MNGNVRRRNVLATAYCVWAEYLCEPDGEDLSEETFRRRLIASGVWSAGRQGTGHRNWRERKTHYGEMSEMSATHTFFVIVDRIPARRVIKSGLVWHIEA